MAGAGGEPACRLIPMPPPLPPPCAPRQLPVFEARASKVAARKVVAHQRLGVGGAAGGAGGAHLEGGERAVQRARGELCRCVQRLAGHPSWVWRPGAASMAHASSGLPPSQPTCRRPPSTGLTHGWLPPLLPRCQHTPFLQAEGGGQRQRQPCCSRRGRSLKSLTQARPAGRPLAKPAALTGAAAAV